MKPLSRTSALALLSVGALVAGGLTTAATANADTTTDAVADGVVQLEQKIVPATGVAIDVRDADADHSTKIVGGVRAPEGAYPWMVQLSIEKNGKVYLCGGTLVSSNIVISAQHCTDGADAVTVRHSSNRRNQGTAVQATGLLEGAGIKHGDWAVLKLADHVNVRSYAKVAADTTYNRGPFRSMGWGTTSSGGRTSDYLLQVDLPFIDDGKCGYGANEICAGDWDRGGIDTCQGDSGGPLVNMNRNDPILVGIVSWGVGCADRRSPGHYTEVSTFESQMANAVSRMGGTMYTRSNGGGGGGPVDPIDPTTPPTTAPVDPTTAPGNPGGDTFSNTTRYSIEDYRTVSSRIRSTKANGQNVTISIDINHPCLEQLELTVVTPDGSRNVVKRASYGYYCTPWRGTKSETYQMRSKTDGSWTLEVRDARSGSTGTLNGWQIKFS